MYDLVSINVLENNVCSLLDRYSVIFVYWIEFVNLHLLRSSLYSKVVFFVCLVWLVFDYWD